MLNPFYMAAEFRRANPYQGKDKLSDEEMLSAIEYNLFQMKALAELGHELRLVNDEIFKKKDVIPSRKKLSDFLKMAWDWAHHTVMAAWGSARCWLSYWW